MVQGVSRPNAPLSERQAEILNLIALGKSNKEIAHQLGLTTGTVKQHVYALFRKLGVRNRTMAVLQGRGAGAPQPEAPGVAPGLPEALHYARRLVTVVVVEPRPEPPGGPDDAAAIERRIERLRARVEQLAYAFDARSELLPGGGVAAWFGQPVAHGDDTERAVAFVRMLQARAAAARIASAVGIGTVEEVLGEGAPGAIAYRTFRIATLLASLAEADAALACELTARLAGLAPAWRALDAPARSRVPQGATLVGPAPPASGAVAAQWGGLPFIPELVANARRGAGHWLGVESWPPQAGTRLIDAIGECLAAQGLPVRALWLPAAPADSEVARRLIVQLRGGDPVDGDAPHGDGLARAIAELASAGPAVLLAYGVDALPTLRATLGASGLARLRGLPLIIVASAMHRTGAPQTAVRLLGPDPAGSPFVRVLRMRVPASAAGLPQGPRQDVQAVLDQVSAEARAVARLASVRATDIAAVVQALGMAREAVVERCRELEAAGLLTVQKERLVFRDEPTAAAVRASLP